MEKQTIYEFFNVMPQEEFEEKFLKISRTDEFSAVASGAGNREDIIKVRNNLIAAGVHKDWLEKDGLFHATIHHITHRIVNKKTT